MIAKNGPPIKNINKAINLSLFDSISLIKGAYSINSRVEIIPHNKTIENFYVN